MNEYKDISELLESDSRAMAFYNSLSLPMQRRLHRKGVRDLKSLYACASSENAAGITDPMNTASANEMTGSVPSGGDLSLDEWENAKDIS
ncbi:MAG: hypothetical protein K6B74_12140 [Ruminococcus sp.]|nr:hypothetical protein [Ruminococcus sp.]